MIAWRREESAFEHLVEAHLRSLYRVALRLTGQHSEAEDLVQDTFLKAFRHRDQLRDLDKVCAWLFSILRSCHLDGLRKKGREPEVHGLTEVDAVTNPPEDWELASDPLGRITEEEVQRVLLTLPEEYRLAVLLCDVEEMSYDEIARVIGSPVGTVRSRIARARSLLRQVLAGYAARQGYGK
ncbi:MAG: sigma-70 family RNA polymerase sigma factor [Candidatus Methylomirabilales bacterium]